MNPTVTGRLPRIPIAGKLLSYKHLSVGVKSVYTGDRFTEYNDVGVWMARVMKQSINISKEHILVYTTTERSGCSDRMPTYVIYKVVGNELVPMCHHRMVDGVCEFCQNVEQK